MSWKIIKLKEVLKQYRIEHRVQDEINYKQVTISKHNGVRFRGYKLGKNIGRKRQFVVDLKNHPKTLMFVRQGVSDGAIGIAPKEVDGCIATENMPMFDIIDIDVDYLQLLIKSPFFRKTLSKIQTTGSAQKSIHERVILEIEIFYPSLKEQKVIVDNFQCNNVNISQISTQLTHQLTLVKQLRQSFLREAMQGKLIDNGQWSMVNGQCLMVNDELTTKKETGAELLARIKAEKEQLIKEKKIKKQKPLPPITDEEIPFDIPENWVWCRLGETGNLLRGKSKHRPRNDIRLFNKGNYPFIQTGDVARSKTNSYVINTINGYYNDFGLAQSTMLNKGTLCITIAANIAEVGFLGFDACAPDSVVYFKSLSQYLNKYVFYFILDAQEEIEKYAPATSQKNINLGILNNLLIPLPPLSEQKAIVKKLDKLMAYCDSLEESIKNSQVQNEMLLGQVLREALENKKEVER